MADEDEEDEEGLFEEFADEEIELADTDLGKDNVLNDEDVVE